MFGLGRKRMAPTGPVPFDFDILIEKPVADVYALVDWADPLNAKRQLGHRVEGEQPSFVLKIDSMPELTFAFEVTEEQKDEVYAFSCDIQPPVGRLKSSTERYTFEPVGDGQCLLRLVNEATFNDGLTMKEFEEELMMMSVATNNGLLKLKVLAEFGLDAAQAVENATFA